MPHEHHTPSQTGLPARSDGGSLYGMNSPEATDEALFTAAGAGDQAAFGVLYGRFAPRVYGLVVKIVGRGPDAEDVLQDVMTELWKRADRYDPALGSPTTWVLMFARSRALDQLRRRKRQDRILNRPSPPSPIIPGRDHDTTDLSPRLAAAIKQLSDDQQAVVTLAFVHGRTREQIAEDVGAPVGTVKTRVRAGMHRLAEILGAQARQTEGGAP